VKLNVPVLGRLTVATLAVLATTYRVSTAPERIRQRLESAKTTCANTGGEWVKVGREESCQPAAERKKS
jgi:hypothetical protein